MLTIRWTCFTLLLLIGLTAGIGMAQDDFDASGVGKVPTGWIAAKTGNGEGSVWALQEDVSAHAGKVVLTQTSSAGPSSLFNLCVNGQPKLLDVDITLSLKALSGKIDQGGGPVWRYQDANNYYIARANPLENNFRLYKVIDGKRTQLATADVEAASGKWHTIHIVHRGNRILCSFNGSQCLDCSDEAIMTAGSIGCWTKADAVTSFTAPKVSDMSADVAPKQVLVVNTQDASVSLVDLVTMKETSRHTVGPRPYGIAISNDGQTVAVGIEDEECVKFFSLPDFKLKGKTPIGKMHNDHIVLTHDGRSVMVANFFSNDVVIIDVQSMKETGRITGCSAPHVVKYGPLKQRAFVTCKKITGIAIIDPASQKLLKFHQLNVNPRSLTFSPDESKVYFGSFWVDGFFEMETESGKVTQLIAFDPPADNAGNQEVTYHGVEAIGNNIVLAANEGRSFVDAVDVSTGKLLDRLTSVDKPCCVERIPGLSDSSVRVLVSNIGDGTLQLVEVGVDGKMKVAGKATVGKAPKRVAFVPAQDN
jgi:DNA-binding beta-propeller fold protein YncE